MSKELGGDVERVAAHHKESVKLLSDLLTGAATLLGIPEKYHGDPDYFIEAIEELKALAAHKPASGDNASAEVDVVGRVLAEVKKATAKFPTWPTDPLHAVAVLGEEFGELTKAALQHVYEPHKSTAEDVRTEAIQTAAMALRFLMSLEAYEYTAGAQHQQEAL